VLTPLEWERVLEDSRNHQQCQVFLLQNMTLAIVARIHIVDTCRDFVAR